MRKHAIVMARALVISMVIIARGVAGEGIQTAGDLFVDLHAADYVEEAGIWPNSPDCLTCSSDFFNASGAPTLQVTKEGAIGIAFDGTNDFFTAEDATPAGLTGLDATRSIEVWALNPSIAGEETLVSWGNRGGPDGTNMAFNYGNHGNFGAVGHWGGDGPDIGWIDNAFTPGAPAAGEWHHLVYTYDGTTTRVYAGSATEPTRLWNEEVLGAGVINTFPNPLMRIASQTEADGVTATPGLRGSLTIGEVRVHDGVLTENQILTNWGFGVLNYPNPEPPPPPVPEPIPSGPNHRYSFDEPFGTEILVDTINEAHGSIIDVGPNDATVNGLGQLEMTGGDQTQADYAAFPAGIVTDTAASGDVGDMTIEVWGTPLSAQNWSRVFSFGSATDNVMHMSWSRGTVAAQNEYRFNQDGQGLGNITLQDFGPNVLGEESHWTVVFDDDGGTDGVTKISIYQNGLLKTEGETTLDVQTLEDDDVWLGRSQWPDAGANANFDEFRLYDYALTANQVLGNYEAGPGSVNIGAVLACDFTNDQVCGLADIDLLMTEVGISAKGAEAGPAPSPFDLNSDGNVDDADRDAWLSQAATENGLSAPYLLGDSNLDLKVDSEDLNAVGISWQTDNHKWSEGNFVGGSVDASDLNEVGIQWQMTHPDFVPGAAVPEPGAALTLLCGLGVLLLRRRES